MNQPYYADASPSQRTRPTWGHAALELVCEILWPTRCAICDKPGDVLCDACRHRLPFIDSCRACPSCGAPFGSIQCSECNPVSLQSGGRSLLPLDAAASAVVFDKRTRRIVSAFKDHGEQRLAADMADIMSRYIAPCWLKDEPVITHIPATMAAYRRRGFDHARLLGSELSKIVGLKHVDLLDRPKSVDQRKLGRKRRHDNMADRFKMLDRITPGSMPSAIILVDDVCTTGATIYSASETVARAGTETIYALTFARTW